MRLSLFAGALTLGFVLACSGEETEEEATTEAAPAEPAPAPAPAPPPRRAAGAPDTFGCCGVPSVQNLMTEYLDLTQALVGKLDTDKISAEGYALEGAANALKNDAALRPVDQKAATDLAALMDRVKNATVVEVRADLPAITNYVSSITRAYPGGELQVAEAECAGVGNWMQVGAVISSPYGASEGGAARAGKAGKRAGGVGAGACVWK